MIWKESALKVAKTNALAIPGGKDALPGCSVEISACKRLVVGLGLSRYPSARLYFGRHQALSSRFKPKYPSRTDSNLYTGYGVLLAVSVGGLFPYCVRLQAKVPRTVSSRWSSSQGVTHQARRGWG